MIVDSTALPEQVVDDVIASGFQSAGQRCSALRVLFLQDGIADKVIDMIRGAMRELHVGNPSKLSTDVGPVIDNKALASLQEHADQMKTKGTLLHICEVDDLESQNGTFFAPRLYEISDLSVLEREVFGPCVHIIRFKPNELEGVMNQIVKTKFGLTMGIHSRIGEKCAYLAERSVAGNVYVNRNMIGAIVGVQPFGGRGLSGTGPKAGGPHYLTRLVKSTDSINVTSLSEAGFAHKDSLAGNSESQNMVVEESLVVLKDGFSEWRYEPLTNRVSVMRQLLAHLSTSEKASALLPNLDQTINTARRQLLKIENKLAIPIQLPGPTGESNWLSFEPRGVIASLLDQQTDLEQWLISIISALAAGNSIIVISENESLTHVAALFSKAISTTGITDNIFKVIPLNHTNLVLENEKLAGAIVDKSSDWQGYLSQKIAERVGEILPVICENDNDLLYYRLITEKTISIDTTAAGGNASLMTMAEEGMLDL